MATVFGQASAGNKQPGPDAIRLLLEEVRDPEIPVLSIHDLGILRDVRLKGDAVTVVITPTYSGCPAMHEIRSEILRVLQGSGLEVSVLTELSPPWSTDDMTEEGRRALLEYGIAPPGKTGTDRNVACPHCGSGQTALVSEFGSTPCKALYRCEDCREPFDHFKCI